MGKSPAFQWYPKDYLSSSRVSMMTLEEEGAYIRALCHCWLNGSIPADPEKLARLIGKGGSLLVATVVQECFIPNPNDTSTMIHERLEEERDKQESWKKKSAEGGKKSAETRQRKKLQAMKGGSQMVATKSQPKGNSSSSSSSSLKESKDSVRSGVADVFEFWKETLGHERTQLDKKRASKIRARLNDGFTVEQLKSAILGNKASAFHQGDNGNGTVYDSIDLIFRDAEKVEQFIRCHERVQSPIEPDIPQWKKDRDACPLCDADGLVWDGGLSSVCGHGGNA